MSTFLIGQQLCQGLCEGYLICSVQLPLELDLGNSQFTDGKVELQQVLWFKFKVVPDMFVRLNTWSLTGGIVLEDYGTFGTWGPSWWT